MWRLSSNVARRLAFRSRLSTATTVHSPWQPDPRRRPLRLLSSESDKRKRPRGKEIIGEMVDSIKELQTKLESLSAPPVWEPIAVDEHHPDEQIHLVVDQARQLVDRIKRHVKDGSITKYRREVSVLLERIMKVYSQLPAPAFDECQRILTLLQAWNLDLQQGHCQYAITAAAREGRWKEAANIFWSHIDPDDSGYTPVDVNVANPVGLYAIARYAQEQGTAVVENVMDGVLRMSMVSPNDQEKYILAAATAIGRAGEWEAFVNYLNTSYNASQMGQPLVAGVMHACILCDQNEKALQVFDNLTKGDLAVADEWQWGGGQDKLHPLCRDLALRALGGSTRPGTGDRALDMFRSIDEDGRSISLEAVIGLLDALEQEGRWAEAVSVFLTVLGRPFASGWLVFGDDLDVPELEQASSAPNGILGYVPLLLDAVMRNCNSAGQFGVSLVASRLLQWSLQSKASLSALSALEDPARLSMAEALAPLIADAVNADSLLASTMVALHGVNHADEANALFEAIQDRNIALPQYGSSQELYELTRRESAFRPTESLPWDAAYRHIQRFTTAVLSISETQEELSDSDRELLSSALATTVSSCSFASHPEVGIILAKWSGIGMADDVRWPVGLSSGGKVKELPMTDPLLASLVEAYAQTDSPEESLPLLETHVKGRESAWFLSHVAAIKVLFALDRPQEAMSLFESIVKQRRSPDLFTVVAQGLMDANNLNAVADIYRLALSSGCLSEELSLLAIQAVCASRKDGKYRIVRNITDEVARIVGVSPMQWIESKYWTLKHRIGFTDASRLMWWNDPKTSHLDELELAMQVFERRRARGLAPKNAVLRVIVKAARFYRANEIPEDRTGLPSLPRNERQWIATLEKVLDGAEQTSLWNDAHFVESAALAFHTLGRTDACFQLLNDALKRGIRIHERAINDAVELANGAVGSDFPADDLRMLSTRA